MEDQTDVQSDLAIDQTVGIVAAYVSNNHVQVSELPALIAATHAALTGLGQPAVPAEPEFERPTPAQIRKSITHEALISFIDGKAYKTLKRHLTKQGLDPLSYRQRYGLPPDYPMVAPSYSETRSALALSLGLGKKATSAPQAEPEVEEAAPSPEADAPKPRSRRKKAAAE